MMCLGRPALDTPHPIFFPSWTPSFITGLAVVGSQARERREGQQDCRWGQWKGGQGWQSGTESRGLSCRGQVACRDKERVSMGLLLPLMGKGRH